MGVPIRNSGQLLRRRSCAWPGLWNARLIALYLDEPHAIACGICEQPNYGDTGDFEPGGEDGTSTFYDQVEGRRNVRNADVDDLVCRVLAKGRSHRRDHGDRESAVSRDVPAEGG